MTTGELQTWLSILWRAVDIAREKNRSHDTLLSLRDAIEAELIERESREAYWRAQVRGANCAQSVPEEP